MNLLLVSNDFRQLKNDLYKVTLKNKAHKNCITKIQ